MVKQANGKNRLKSLVDNAEEVCASQPEPESQTSNPHPMDNTSEIIGESNKEILNAESKTLGENGASQTRRAMVLADLAEAAELFHAPDGTAYADVHIGGRRATWPVKSNAFRQILTHLYFNETGSAPRSDALNEVLSTLDARARFASPKREVFRRVARVNDRVYIDLGDDTWRAIVVDASGWWIVDTPPVRFVRSRSVRALPVPVRGAGIDQLCGVLNLRFKQDLVLVVSWILAALATNGPFPILVINGEQGSAKSTFSKIVRALVDPNEAPVRSMPRNEQDLCISACQSRVLAFDNLSGITPAMSDALCRVATGGAFSTRKLFSDKEEVLLSTCNPVIINGIGDTVARADLADRSIFITLEPIPDDERRASVEVMADFEAMRAPVFGALLDAISTGLHGFDAVHLPSLPRMADFAKWAVACETNFWPEGTFMSAYTASHEAANNDQIDADAVAAALRKVMSSRADWSGTATDLMALIISEGGASETLARALPSSPEGLSVRIRRVEPLLRKIGIRIERRREGKFRARVLQFSNTAYCASASQQREKLSALSAASADTENPRDINTIRKSTTRTRKAPADTLKIDTQQTVRRKPLKNRPADRADGADSCKQPLATPESFSSGGDGCEPGDTRQMSDLMPKSDNTLEANHNQSPSKPQTPDGDLT